MRIERGSLAVVGESIDSNTGRWKAWESSGYLVDPNNVQDAWKRVTRAKTGASERHDRRYLAIVFQVKDLYTKRLALQIVVYSDNDVSQIFSSVWTKDKPEGIDLVRLREIMRTIGEKTDDTGALVSDVLAMIERAS